MDETLNNKHETLRMEVIEMLVKNYPNDFDLGQIVREFVNKKENLNSKTCTPTEPKL